MERLIMLGTGNALVTRCYNSCFVIQRDDEYMLIDAGGGNGVLRQLEDVGVDYSCFHHIYLTHEHTDHMIGMIWILRMIGTKIRKDAYEGDLYIYGHSELMEKLRTVANLTLPKKITWLFDHRIIFVPIYDGDRMNIMDYDMTFFDIGSTKVKQYGFTMQLKNGKRLTCAGDEPLQEQCYDYAKGADWLIHEAFCLYSQREQYNPYEKHHSTVKEACELADYLDVPNLILFHTEDDNISRRKTLYSAEARLYYHGNLYIPDDLETIEL